MTLQGRVLVVDDDRAVRSALRVNLSKAGLDVTLAETGEIDFFAGNLSVSLEIGPVAAGYSSYIVRCSGDGKDSGFLGSGSNAIAVHDPSGAGGLGIASAGMVQP